MQIEERDRMQRIQKKAGEEWLLNNDIDKQDRQSGSGQTGGRKAKADPFDSRPSRSEDSSDALVRPECI